MQNAATLVSPLKITLPDTARLVVLDARFTTLMAVRALWESTQIQEGRLEWIADRGPRPTTHTHQHHTLFRFPDSSMLAAQRIASTWYLFPAAFLFNGQATLEEILHHLRPYLDFAYWRTPVHVPENTNTALYGLLHGHAFLPHWGQANLFPAIHTDALRAVLWAAGEQMRTALHITTPFTLTFMGSTAGQHHLEPPTLSLSLPGREETLRWRAWLSALVAHWLKETLGNHFLLHCIHQHPPLMQGVLCQAYWPERTISAHQALHALQFINHHLPRIQAQYP